jgi:hypothetical protein
LQFAHAECIVPRGKRPAALQSLREDRHGTLLAITQVELLSMRIITGTVRGGHIVVEDAALAEGEKVTVLAREGGETFAVTPEEKRFLLESIAEADRGEFVDTEELFRELDEAN